MSEPTRSVFGKVDQREMVKRLSEAPEGDIDAMLPPATEANPAVLAGIDAFAEVSGAATSEDGDSAPEITGYPGRRTSASDRGFSPVSFRGRLVDDLAASRAFVLHGPLGVTRLP